jgi:hypothetical protein
MNVQHLSEDDQDAPDNEYEGIACPACAKVHFVNRKTGKLLGQDEQLRPLELTCIYAR